MDRPPGRGRGAGPARGPRPRRSRWRSRGGPLPSIDTAPYDGRRRARVTGSGHVAQPAPTDLWTAAAARARPLVLLHDRDHGAVGRPPRRHRGPTAGWRAQKVVVMPGRSQGRGEAVVRVLAVALAAVVVMLVGAVRATPAGPADAPETELAERYAQLPRFPSHPV